MSSMKWMFWVLIVLLASFAGRAAQAQEVQLAFDEAGRLVVLEAREAGRLGLFGEYAGFIEARLFGQPDGAAVLEILHKPAREVVRVRQPLTAAELAALRARIAAQRAAAPEPAVLDQSGRPRLLKQAALASLFFYGPALPFILGVEEPGAVGGLYLMGASAGFFGPFFLTRDVPVTEGATALAGTGAAFGALHGLGLMALAGADDLSGRAYVTAAVGLSVAEAVAGFRYAARHGLTAGDAGVISTGGTYGATMGLLSSVLLLAEVEDAAVGLRAAAGLGLAGSAAGLYAGRRLSRMEPYTEGDVTVLGTAGGLGFYTTAAALELTDVSSPRLGAALLMAGTTAGMAVGRRLSHDVDFTRGQGVFLSLGTLAGGLFGAGLATIIEGDASASGPGGVSYGPDGDPIYVEDEALFEGGDALYLGLSAAGAMAGFGLMYRIYAGEARAAHRAARGLGALRIRVHPEGVLHGLRHGPAVPTPRPVSLFSLQAAL